MMRVVLDANVLVSGVVGLERQESTPGALLRAWQSGRFTLLTSTPLIAEVRRALADQYFQRRLRPEQIERFVTSLTIDATVVEVTLGITGVATHPEDDLVLSAAGSARATYLVTGDVQLQRLDTVEDTKIVSPRAFLAIIQNANDQ